MRRTGERLRGWSVALITAAGIPAACGGNATAPDPVEPAVPVAAVSIAPETGVWTGTMHVGQSVSLVATALAADGSELPVRPVTWSSTDTAVATVNADGGVTGRGDGDVVINATIAGTTGSLPVFVTAVASLVVTPGAAVLAIGQTRQYSARAYDLSGAELFGRAVVWSTPSPDIVSISPDGLVTALAHGYGQVDAMVDGMSSSVALTVMTPEPVTAARP